MKVNVQMLLLIISIVIVGGSNTSFGQVSGKSESLMSSPNVALNSQAENTLQPVVDNEVDLFNTKPVTIKFKNGQSIKGNLLQNDSANPSSIWVEIAGRKQSIPYEVIYSIKDEPRRLDKFSFVNLNQMKAIVDNNSIEIQSNLFARLFIIGFGQKSGTGLFYANGVKSYLINKKKIDPARITVINAGLCDEDRIEIWLIPPGTDMPIPNC